VARAPGAMPRRIASGGKADILRSARDDAGTTDGVGSSTQARPAYRP